MKVTVETAKAKWEALKEKFKEGCKTKAKQASCWAYNNQDKIKAAIQVMTAVVYGGTKIIVNAQKNHHQKVQEESKFLNVYDPANGQYLRLKKPMSNQQKCRLNELRENGYTVTSALEIMGLLD